MGRLDDIIERNKNPKTSFRKAKSASKVEAPPVVEEAAREPEPEPEQHRVRLRRRDRDLPMPKAGTSEVNQAEQGENKGRLDRIIERNKHPDAQYRWLKVGLAGIVLFVVLVLLIFTDLAAPPEAAYPEPTPAAKPTGVDGVKLWRPSANKPAAK